MRRRGWLGIVWMVLGCGPVVGQDGSTSGSTTSVDPSTTVSSTTIASTTSSGTTTTSSGTTTIDPSEDDSVGDTDGTFIMEPDGADGGDDFSQCDEWAQDCPEGEKCMPWANDGGMSWNAVRCSAIGDMMVGDPCTVEGSAVSGIDDCEAASMCWNVDPETNMGTCVAFCMGSEANPMCDRGTDCVIANDGVLILCLPCCDPRLAGCIEGQRCLPFDTGFHCLPDAGGMAATGEECSATNECAAGLCLGAAMLPECTSLGCCSPWCTLGDDAACEAALPGTVCMPWLPDGEPPNGCGNETLGYCALPM